MTYLAEMFTKWTDETEDMRIREMEGDTPLHNAHVADFLYQAACADDVTDGQHYLATSGIDHDAAPGQCPF